MFDEGIVYFDTLGFGWVVEWDLIRRIYSDYWNGVAPNEGFQSGDTDDPFEYNSG